MIRKNKSAKTLVGSFVLPTSAKAHIHEPTRCTAFVAGQYSYLLQATQSLEDGGYPAQVVVTSREPVPEFIVGEEVATQHAQVRKNLPPRRVAAVINPDGSYEGDISSAPRGLGLPHWEFIPANPDGSANLGRCNEVAERIAANKEAATKEKEAIAAIKKGAKVTPVAATTETSGT